MLTTLVNEKSLKAELLNTAYQIKILKESFNDLEQYFRRDCLEIRFIPKNDTREDVNKIVMHFGQKIGVNLNKEDKPSSPNKGKYEQRKGNIPTSNYSEVHEPGCLRAIL